MVAEVAGYILRERLGSSATSTVWRGEAVGAPGRVVAIELVPHMQGRGATDVLQREAEILGRLSHPHILPVVAVVPTNDGLALVTAYASGGSLATMVHRGSSAPPGSDPPHGSGRWKAHVANLGARLASALAAVHGAGIVHGDLRPANVRFDRERRPLLAHVGIARLYGDVCARAGTAEYLDPGLLDGHEPDTHSDLYALGVTLYEALAGVPPYTGATTAQTLAAAEHGRFVPLADRVQAPPALTAVIEAAFARDLRDRPAGAHEVAGHLEDIRRMMDDDEPSPQHPATSGRAGVLGAVPGPGRTSSRARRRERHAPTPASPGPSSTTDAGMPWTPVTVGGDAVAPRHLTQMLLVAAAIVLVPTAIVIASFRGDAPETADAEDATGAADAPVAQDARDAEDDEDAPVAADAPPADEPVAPPNEREFPPSCDGMQAPDDGREILLADLDGVGCSSVIAWDGQRLDVLGVDGSVERYDLGARPGDVLRFGDWACDGRDTPALYRPVDGQLFTFDEIAPGARTTATGAPTGTLEGVPTVVTDPAGCDRMEVDP